MEEIRKKYAAEAKQRWGKNIAYAEYEEKASGYDEAQWKMLDGEGAAILSEFRQSRHLDPTCCEAQALVKKWQAYITANYYNCTTPILSCLGQMYAGNKRFTQNIDQFGAGTAAFMAAAIGMYCQRDHI